jgi:arabinofuranosyltransferase
VGGRQWARLLGVSLGPLVAWSLFALIYYGSILPNPALARLNAGIGELDIIGQGARYLLAALRYDTITGAILVGTLVVSLLGRKRHVRWLGYGVLADLIYVVSVGGDFMQGRFLSCAFFLSTIALLACWETASRTNVSRIAAAALALYAVVYPHTPVNSGGKYVNGRRYHGIADERGCYFRQTSLWAYVRYTGEDPGKRTPYFPDHEFSRTGYELSRNRQPVAPAEAIGMLGYWAGTNKIIIDQMGLADPLLARMPVSDANDWRIGHFRRDIPPGYYESLWSGSAKVRDPGLNEFYKKVKTITQDRRLFSSRRLETILLMNLGKYKPPGAHP